MLSPRQVKVRRAFLVAPLIGPVALALGVGVAAMLDGSTSPRYAIDTAGVLALPFFIFGFPFAYAVGLVVGLPSYWLLKRHDRLQLIPILAITGGLGPIALLAAASFWTGDAAPRILLFLAVTAGMAVGLTFWLLGVGGVFEDSVA